MVLPIRRAKFCSGIRKSKQASTKRIAVLAPRIKTLVEEPHRGFVHANNQALLESKGEIIAFVNNDTVLEPNWLAQIVEPFQTNPDAGMCAGKTLSYFHRDIIDNTGHLLYWDGVNR